MTETRLSIQAVVSVEENSVDADVVTELVARMEVCLADGIHPTIQTTIGERTETETANGISRVLQFEISWIPQDEDHGYETKEMVAALNTVGAARQWAADLGEDFGPNLG